jgi:hypothetical protein
MTKLEQLKEMVARWEKEKSLMLAYDICEFLSKNLEKSDGEKEKSSPEG